MVKRTTGMWVGWSNLLFFAGILVTLTTCKTSQSRMGRLSDTGLVPPVPVTETNVNPVITFEYLHDGTIKRIHAGITQPDGSIHYLPRGMEEMRHAVQYLLTQRHIDANFLQNLRQDHRNSRLAYQMGRHNIPQGLIPIPLWNKGVRFEMLLWPDKKYHPDSLLEAHQECKSQADTETAEQVKLFFPMLCEDTLSFQKYHAMYEKTWNLPPFQVVRSEIKKDGLYRTAAKSMELSTISMTGVLFTYTGAHLEIFFKTAFAAVRGGGALAWFFSGILATIPPLALREAYFNLATYDEETLKRLRERDALATFGLDGNKSLLKNEQFLQELKNSTLKDLSAALEIPMVQGYLLDPTHHYDLKKMAEAADRVNLTTLKNCIDRDKIALKKISDSFPSNAPEKLESIVFSGSRSALFCELMLLAKANVPELRIDFEPKLVAGSVGHSQIEKKLIQIQSTQNEWSTTLVLGHEFWHMAKTYYVFAQIYRFADSHEFLYAIASEEILAMIFGGIIQDQVDAYDRRLPFNLKRTFSKMNILNFYTTTSAMLHPDEARQLAYLMSMQANLQFWAQWRRD